MRSTASATDPVSYSEVLSAFWAAARAACGTDLRGQSLVNLEVLGPVLNSFVAELESKLRPAGIEYGLGQAGSGQSTGINVPDADAPVLAHEPGGQLMQEVLPTVRDLGVDGSNSGLAPGTLRNGERLLVLAAETRRLDLLARRKRCQALEAQVDTDLASPVLSILRNLDLQIEIPAATGILSEAAAAKLTTERPAEPEPISALEEDHRITVPADRARRLEGDPPQRSLLAPPRPLAMGISRDRKLPADGLNGIRMQAEELAAAESELDQIEARWPAFVVPPGGLLNLPAVVPHPVHRPSLLLKVPTGGRILDPVPICQHHGNMVIDTRCENKTDAKHPAGIFTPDLPSVCDAETHASTNSTVIDNALPPRRERGGFLRGELR